MTNHTPTPWIWEDITAGSFDDACIVTKSKEVKHTDSVVLYVAQDYDNAWLEIREADAQHIVHCVNTYPALVEALENAHLVLKQHYDSGGFINCDVVSADEICKEALTKNAKDRGME